MRCPAATFLLCLVASIGLAQETPAEFAVLRADRVVVPIGESEHLSCSISGIGNEAEMSCESHKGEGIPLVFHVALVVGSNHVAYVVSCGGGLVRRIGCQALSAGQVLKGTVGGGKLSVALGAKTKTYRVETSSYIGPVRVDSSTSAAKSPSEPEPAEEPAVQPSVKRTIQTERSGQSTDVRHEAEVQNGPAHDAKVMISSEPSGAEIYVDDAFMGNTPSLVQLTAGSHAIRIEAKGYKTWSRATTLTEGGKVTLQATLEPGQ